MTENLPPRDPDDKPISNGPPIEHEAEFMDRNNEPGLLVDAITSGPGDHQSGAIDADHEFTVVARSQWSLVLRRFRQHKLAVVSLFVLLAVILFAFVGGPLWHYKPTQFTNDFSVPPSTTHPFGTDSNGADHMAQVMAGTQLSLKIAFSVA